MVGIVVVEVDHGPQRVEQRLDGRLADQRGVVAATSTGTPAPTSERRSAGMQARPERTSTAMSDQAMPSSRWARRSRSARCSASARSVSKVSTSTRPSPRSFGAATGSRKARRASSSMEPGQAEPPGHPLGGEQHPGAEAPGRAQRHHVGGPAVAPRERGREVEDAAHLRTAEAVDRLVRVADDRQVAAVADQGAAAARTWPGSVSWYSSTKTWLNRWPQLDAVRLGLDDRAPDQVGVVDGALGVEDVEVLLEEEPGGDVLRQVGLDAERPQGRAVEPLLAGPGRAPPAPRGRSRGCRPRGAACRASGPTRGCR